MVSLMPLQRSVTPWKVSGGSNHGRGPSCDLLLAAGVDAWLCSGAASDPTLQRGRVHGHFGSRRAAADLAAPG